MSKRRSSGAKSSSSPSVLPPRGRFGATPALGTRLPAARASAPDDLPWKKKARALLSALEEVLNGPGEASEVACVERAWAAWELGGVQPKVAARVAYLVERAHGALHENKRPPTEQAMQGGAHVLYNSLPSAVRATTDYARVLKIVRALAVEHDAWPAVVRGASDLLGWTHVGLTHASHALRVAMASRIERLG